jgi:Mrp family chromosome partitioning ATPase
MISQEKLQEILGNIPAPGNTRKLVDLNTIREVKIDGEKVEITAATTVFDDQAKIWLKGAIENVALKQDGVKEVNVNLVALKPKEINAIGSVIAVMSGKGGVGKSLVTGLMSVALRKQGYRVGILDADITGPSIPKMFGLTEKPYVTENGILPVQSSLGIEVMSINLLLQNDDDAVIWRGPLIGQIITQFWADVVWGKMDYLIVDLPPGTSDAPLTVLQTLPVNGIIIVFTPQDLTAMVVRKAVNMAKQMKKNIIGVVENMSYLYIPEINKKMEIFGKSRGDEMARIAGAPLLAQIPVDPELVKLCDQGNIESYNTEIYGDFARNLFDVLLTEGQAKNI